MIQGDIELDSNDKAFVHALMENPSFVTIMTKIVMVKEQDILRMMAGFAKQGIQHEVSKCAGYHEALEDMIPSLRAIAKSHTNPPPKTE